MYLFQFENKYLQIREIKSQINNKRGKWSCEQTAPPPVERGVFKIFTTIKWEIFKVFFFFKAFKVSYMKTYHVLTISLYFGTTEDFHQPKKRKKDSKFCVTWKRHNWDNHSTNKSSVVNIFISMNDSCSKQLEINLKKTLPRLHHRTIIIA